MTGSVGIKEANGNFYPIVEVNKAAKKRLLLTTAHDNQKSVQIDLYKSVMKSMVDALYIGSVVVENITPRTKGKASIEMTFNSSPDGTITVDVVETGNPSNEHHLTISLDSLEEDKTDYRDFEMNEKGGVNKRVRVKGRKGKFPWIVIIMGIVLALICLALWFFLIRNPDNLSRLRSVFAAKTSAWRTDNPAPANTAADAPSAAPAKTEEPPVQTVVIEKAPSPQAAGEAPGPQAAGEAPSPQAAGEAPGSLAAGEAPGPAASQPSSQAVSQAPAQTRGRTPNRINAPRTIPPDGITYRVRWGDTLWDIAEAFYRNPRLYPVIARSNNIPNPNRIVSGTELVILPRN